MSRQAATDDYNEIVYTPVFLGVPDIPGDAHIGTFREKNGGGFGVAGIQFYNQLTILL
jgi:hypothetical protein